MVKNLEASKKNKKPKLILLCGLPRSGKSTWVKKHAKEYVVVCPDAIRKEIFGHQFHAFANNYVFAMAEAMVLLLLKQNKDVIVDATNLNEFSRSRWIPIARATNASVEVVWTFAHPDCEKNLKLVKERNAKSPDGERLPEEALDRMYYMFEEPSESDTWYKLTKFYNRQRPTEGKSVSSQK